MPGDTLFIHVSKSPRRAAAPCARPVIARSTRSSPARPKSRWPSSRAETAAPPWRRASIPSGGRRCCRAIGRRRGNRAVLRRRRGGPVTLGAGCRLHGHVVARRADDHRRRQRILSVRVHRPAFAGFEIHRRTDAPGDRRSEHVPRIRHRAPRDRAGRRHAGGQRRQLSFVLPHRARLHRWATRSFFPTTARWRATSRSATAR